MNWRTQGMSLVEVVVGISILSTIMVSVGIGVTSFVDARGRLLTEAKATYLAEEGYETLRAIRDEDWADIAAVPVGTTRYLDVTATTIGITTTPEVIDTSYTRSFQVQELRRDSNDDIVTTGGTIDSDSVLVEILVTGPNGTVSLESILSNVHNI